MRKIILIFLISGVVLGIIGFWYWTRNPYSKEVLKLEIIAPESAEIFEEIEYVVKYKNNGNVRLEEPRLIFEFPENTLVPISSEESGEGGEPSYLKRQEVGPEELGDIYPGEEKTFKFKGRLFGKEGDIKTAKAWMNYQPKNIEARYESATTSTTVIKSIPLTFDFDLSSKVESGRDFKFSLNYFSSLNYPLTNLGIQIEYPSGFEFLSSNPKSLGKTEWDIPLLNRAEGGRVEIEGRLSGDLKEQKIFRATLGAWHENEFIPLKEVTKGVEIVKPNLYIFQRINGSDQPVVNPGSLLHYEIFFRNVSEEPFTDLFLVVSLNGKAFDFNSIKSDQGQFSSGDDSIIWDWRDIPELKFLGQGEEGKVEFWVSLKNWEISNSQDKNFVLRNSVLLSQVKEQFEVKLSSNLAVSQRAYYKDEVFGNSGPIPPEVGKKTTYTINWQAKNYYNDVKNVTVRAVLPTNVELTGEIFPEDQTSKFSFDRLSREIIWRIADGEIMEAGTGIINSAPNITFQIALTPDSDQRGETAPIIGEARIRGEDQWTETIIEKVSLMIDTALPDDSSVSEEEGIVK